MLHNNPDERGIGIGERPQLNNTFWREAASHGRQNGRIIMQRTGYPSDGKINKADEKLN